jgi:hypothetical protein
MNGVDVSRLQVGDVIELTEDRAQMMIEQGWAEAIAPSTGASPLESQPSPRHPN